MKNVLILICIMGILLSGCGLVAGGDKFAESFLEKYKSGDYEGMYGMVHGKYKEKMQFPEFKLFHEKVLEKLGDIKDYKKVNWSFVTSPGSVTIMLRYEITFSKYKGICDFRVLKEGNNVSIASDNFNSEGFRDIFMK